MTYLTLSKKNLLIFSCNILSTTTNIASFSLSFFNFHAGDFLCVCYVVLIEDDSDDDD